MSLSTNVQDLATSVATELKATRNLLNGNAGDLSALTTTAKTSLLAAINELQAEVLSAAGGGVAINDAGIATDSTWSSSKIDATIDSDVSAAVTALVNGAPGALDTLAELATALENAATDSEVAAILTALGMRVRVDEAQAFTDPQKAQARSNIGAGTSDLVIGTTGTTAKAGNWTPTAAQISDSTATGRSVITATDAAAARTAIGAGTSNLVIGTTGTTAKAGDYAPPTASETTAGLVEMATTAETSTGTDTLRAVTPAGVKAVADTKAPLSHTHTAAQVSDASIIGRTVLTAADGPAIRSVIGAGTSDLVIGTTETTAMRGNWTPPSATATAQGIVELATNAETTTGTDTARAVTPAGVKAVADTKANTVHTHTASQISDASATGRSVLTAADAAAARTVLGAASATGVGETEVDLVAVFNAGLLG